MNKPVAWMDKNDRTRIQLEQEWADDIPLYTHPVKEQEPDLYSEDGFPLWTSPQFKELTDEEIHKLWLECWDEIEFAKAILRKAQEK